MIIKRRFVSAKQTCANSQYMYRASIKHQSMRCDAMRAESDKPSRLAIAVAVIWFCSAVKQFCRPEAGQTSLDYQNTGQETDSLKQYAVAVE